MSPRIAIFAPLPVLALALACSDPAAAPQSSTLTPPPNSVLASPPIHCEEDAQLDIAGIYAVYARLTMNFRSRPGGATTVCPSDQSSAGALLAVMRVNHDDPSAPAKVEARVCNLELPVMSAVVGKCQASATNYVSGSLEIPPALVDALPVATRGVANAWLTGRSPGAWIEIDPMSFRLGTRLSVVDAPAWRTERSGCGTQDLAAGRTRACDEACVDDCEGLVDDDHDGWPGVTVHVCGTTADDEAERVPCHPTEPSIAGTSVQGRIGVTLQVEPAFRGNAVSSCELRGNVDARIDYGVVGGDIYIANTQISVTSASRSLPMYEVVATQSSFRAVRIDGAHGSPDWGVDLAVPLDACRAVIARQNELH